MSRGQDSRRAAPKGAPIAAPLGALGFILPGQDDRYGWAFREEALDGIPIARVLTLHGDVVFVPDGTVPTALFVSALAGAEQRVEGARRRLTSVRAFVASVADPANLERDLPPVVAPNGADPH